VGDIAWRLILYRWGVVGRGVGGRLARGERKKVQRSRRKFGRAVLVNHICIAVIVFFSVTYVFQILHCGNYSAFNQLDEDLAGLLSH